MKPPAFQFYPEDFLGGTSDMTSEEVGAYIRLLCNQWSKGGLPADDVRLAIMAGQCQASSLAKAKTKFRICEDGLLRNERMEAERLKQSQFREKQALNGSKRWLGNAKPDALALPGHLPNACSPSPSPSPNKKERGTFVPPTHDEVMEQAGIIGLPESEARKFIPFYESKGWMVGKTKMKSWVMALSGWKARWDEKNPAPSDQDDIFNLSQEELKRRVLG